MVSSRIVRSLFWCARIQAASFDPPQYCDDENTVSSLPFCWTWWGIMAKPRLKHSKTTCPILFPKFTNIERFCQKFPGANGAIFSGISGNEGQLRSQKQLKTWLPGISIPFDFPPRDFLRFAFQKFNKFRNFRKSFTEISVPFVPVTGIMGHFRYIKIQPDSEA